jgi:hypothetical protein
MPSFQAPNKRADHNDLTDQPGGFRRQSISEHAHPKAQHRTSEDRRGDDEAALLRGQVQVGGDLHRQRAEQVPDHEAQVEIEEGREQGRGVAGFPEA